MDSKPRFDGWGDQAPKAHRSAIPGPDFKFDQPGLRFPVRAVEPSCATGGATAPESSISDQAGVPLSRSQWREYEPARQLTGLSAGRMNPSNLGRGAASPRDQGNSTRQPKRVVPWNEHGRPGAD